MTKYASNMINQTIWHLKQAKEGKQVERNIESALTLMNSLLKELNEDG